MGNIRVIYDYQAFTLQTHGGISRCFAELYKHLPQEVTAQIAVRESDNVYIREMEGVMPTKYKYNNFICRKDFKGKGHLHLWYDKLTKGGYYPNYNRHYSIELLRRGEFDIFHPTFYSDYFLPYLKGKPFVLTIHDMIPELYPQYFPQDDIQIVMKRKLVPLASAIVAVSENTKKDVIRILNVPEEKVHVVYHGCSFSRLKEVPPLLNKPYLLYVGDRYGYKNFKMFVRYVASFLKSHVEVSVVCTGRLFNQEEEDLFSELGVRDRFIHYWVSSDENLFSLYHYALCFVYTSEYEGFGIPILEAYQAECPVLLNQRSCFPEIAGDAAIYFEMNSESSNIVYKLESIYKMKSEERKSLLVRQRKRLELYSWSKSSQQLVNIYNSILHL